MYGQQHVMPRARTGTGHSSSSAQHLSYQLLTSAHVWSAARDATCAHRHGPLLFFGAAPLLPADDISTCMVSSTCCHMRAPLLVQQQHEVLVGEGDGRVRPGALEARAVAVAPARQDQRLCSSALALEGFCRHAPKHNSIAARCCHVRHRLRHPAIAACATRNQGRGSG
jgi:hypothetical protein